MAKSAQKIVKMSVAGAATRSTQVKSSGNAPAPTAVNRWATRGGEVGIRVRMYRVGFGDFFLLSFQPDSGSPVHVIVDCGVFKGTSQTGDIGTLEACVADMAATTNGEVALIVVTHRHADHIAGFGRCAAIFDALKVESIWMSIWESQYPAAQKLQSQLAATAERLRSHFAGISAARITEDEETARKYMENAKGEGGAGANAKALRVIKERRAGPRPEFYQAGQTPKLAAAFVRAGIGARIFGPPPIEDLQLMKLMDLQKGVGQYFAAQSATSSQLEAPFGDEWEVAPASYPRQAFTEWRRRGSGGLKKKSARDRMQQALAEVQPDAALIAAKQLNSFLNNQSLVVLFTFKGKNLLFVGDAQAGNWEHWVFGTDDPNKSGQANLSEDAKELLTSLDFYKVGHHGSSNATPKVVVETMSKSTRKFAAMCSTQKDVYGKENVGDPAVGTEVPRLPLVAALGAVSSFVRSDQIDIKGQVGVKAAPAQVVAPLPAAGGAGRFERGALWIDCFL